MWREPYVARHTAQATGYFRQEYFEKVSSNGPGLVQNATQNKIQHASRHTEHLPAFAFHYRKRM